MYCIWIGQYKLHATYFNWFNLFEQNRIVKGILITWLTWPHHHHIVLLLVCLPTYCWYIFAVGRGCWFSSSARHFGVFILIDMLTSSLVYALDFLFFQSSAVARTVGHLSKSAEVMKLVNNLMKAPEVAVTMLEFSKEMTKVVFLLDSYNSVKKRLNSLKWFEPFSDSDLIMEDLLVRSNKRRVSS